MLRVFLHITKVFHKIFVFECTCCFDMLPGQCFCWVSRPHIQNETVLLWSTKEICEGQEKYTNIISVFILIGKKYSHINSKHTISICIRWTNHLIPTLKMAFHVARVKVNETNNGTHSHTMEEKPLVQRVGVDKSQSLSNHVLMRTNWGNQVWVWTDRLKAVRLRDYRPLAWRVGCLTVRCSKIAGGKGSNYGPGVLSALVNNGPSFSCGGYQWTMLSV